MILDLSKLQNVKITADGWVAACPCCRAEGKDSKGNHLGILRDGTFNCIVAPGDKHHNKVILSFAGNGERSSEVYAPTPQELVVVDKIYDPSLLNKLVKNYSYWNERGISDEVLEWSKGGVAIDGQMKDRFVFPLFDAKKQIIAFTGRALKKEMSIKWKHLGQTSKCLWGNFEEIEATKRVILVESIGDALKLMTSGVKDVIVLFGVNISQAVIGKVIELSPNKIIISTNNDERNIYGKTPGQDAARKIKRSLDKFFNEDRIEICFPPKKDWGECSAEEIKEIFKDD